jgi:AcrR family transcriptional regulator
VGTGSIYRYFKDKEDLIHQVFEHLEEQMGQSVLQDHDSQAPFRAQYIRLALNMFHFSIENPKIHGFYQQYFNSPFGISRRQALMGPGSDRKDPKKEHPMASLLRSAREEQVVKDLPIPVLMGLTLGPMVFLIRDALNGLVEMSPENLMKSIEACWDAVKR